MTPIEECPENKHTQNKDEETQTGKQYDLLCLLQPRCVECGSKSALHIHHRIFRSEGEYFLKNFLKEHGKKWGLNDIENLVRLCQNCHLHKAHSRDREIRDKYRLSYTCKRTGMNIPFEKKPKNYLAFLK